MSTTLKMLAASDHPASRGAAALIEAGYPDSTPLEALTPGSVTRTLAELFSRELAKIQEQLGEVYEGAFVDTATGESLQVLVDGLCPRRAWWWRLFRSRG
jgi:hypothetical protein